ncbi:MAG: adenylyltransferase/cytidyltransferase family protein [Alphaproteobacteria bacterium]|nr:adenylyltransferase/cytidyltransferase family protein [Alphaproteobacteria bacterium]
MTLTLASKYGNKIKTAEELIELIGPRPRKHSVVMCHGVFDLVHPGHIRHLLYAKSKADILVASLTADQHINKAQYRPFVPQDLRALNLAALEMVDYVVIDPDPTPLANIAHIQPDLFAKGYEYQDTGIHPKTQEELDLVTSYGGEMLFTPGDIVYSSSAIIETVPPNLTVDKLVTLMEAENITFDRLRQTLAKAKGIPVHVVGDTIVDSLTYTTLIGGMTKSPTPSVRFDRKVDFIGGAAVVARHLRAAGAQVSLSTVLGKDEFKKFVLDGLAQDGITCQAVIDRTRPTTNKNAIVCGGYRLLKVDNVDTRPVMGPILDKLVKQIAETPAKGVVFSDFRHGIFNRRTIPVLAGAIPAGVLRVADSQVASRWGNILEFEGFDLITPNEREARFALADQDSGVRPLASSLFEAAKCGTLILKLGERGIITWRSTADHAGRPFLVLDSFADRVVDPVGAGDALLAYSTLAMLVGESEAVASILGSIAAALECEHDGNIPIGIDKMLESIASIEKCAEFR